ncbi:hypothetical protein E4G67_04035 [Candidatus Bathyarchaeota archaeon]|nr:MAG: hypothetical protein E4G67_04035 [Candidatus Bathyarchaeota archaeon]
MLVILAALDPVGNVSLSLQVVILFLLILGLPFVRRPSNQKNLMLHGYLTVLALALHTILIFLAMIPSFANGFSELGDLSLFSSVMVWSHAILGTAAEVLGILLIASWLVSGPSKMACSRWKKWMMPIFIIWVISIINGALVHILGLL